MHSQIRMTAGARNAMSRLFRHYFLPRHRLLMGDYSDVLTDPFRSSEKVDDYACN